MPARLPDAPGCLVLDVRLPGMSGLEFQTHLAEKGIRLPVILMTAHGDVPMSVRGMKAGAVDFLTNRVVEQLDKLGFGYLKVDYNETIGIGCEGAESLGEGLRRIQGMDHAIGQYEIGAR